MLASNERPSRKSTRVFFEELSRLAEELSQQTFILMQTSYVFVFRRCLQDVLIKTNMFALALRLQKTSWSRPIYSSWPYVFKTSSRRLQDDFKTSSRSFQDVLKTFWSRPIYSCWPYVFNTSSRCLQDVFKMSSRRLQDVLRTSSRCLQDFFKTYNQVKLF